MSRIRALCGALVVGAIGLGASGCSADSPGGTDGDAGAGPRVVVTTSILGDVVGAILGDAGTVEVLMPAGVDPHGFAPSARDAASLRDADLVVANGLGLEESLLDALSAAEEDGVPVLHVAEEADPIAAPGDDDEDEHVAEEDGHGHGDRDPHVWLDPVRMADAAELIAARIAEADADGALTDAEWHARGAAYADQLRALHDQIVEILSVVPDERRLLVTEHDNLRYFADRYGFEVVGTTIPGTSSQAQPSTREIVALAQLIRRLDVPAIFTDVAGGDDRLATTLAAEVGDDVAVVGLYTDALGEDGSEAGTLIGLLRTNAQRIADALG